MWENFTVGKYLYSPGYERTSQTFTFEVRQKVIIAAFAQGISLFLNIYSIFIPAVVGFTN
jgi:hypothetical protein